LIQATLQVLKVDDTTPKNDPRRRLELLFATAQMADINLKLFYSLKYGLFVVH
jgi:hypothetical protein